MVSFFKEEEKRVPLILVISLAALVASFFHIVDLPVDLAWIAILLCGIPIIKGAIVGLVTESDIKADVLVSIALIASIVIGEIFAAGEVAFIMALGAYLEDRTVSKARAGIEKLVQLRPTEARVVVDGKEQTVPADQVKKGDILRVLAGETIATDGRITNGKSSINQAVMTGESLPVDKEEGDEVFSGTVNQFGTFEMVAEKVGADSSLQRMIRLVESADAGKAEIVGMADRWATWIVLIALAAAAGTWFWSGEIIRSVTILVVFCPCALVLATPTAIMAGIGNASKYGILIREGDALERLAQVVRMAFDKTGTLTSGIPEVAVYKSCHSSCSDTDILDLTAAAELRSEHPLGKAIVARYRAYYKKQPIDPEEFELLPGRGVKAAVRGRVVYAGNQELLKDQGILVSREAKKQAEAFIADGSTMIWLTDEKTMLGFLVLSDTIRADIKKTITAIRSVGVDTVLLTGDAPEAAQMVAGTAGIGKLEHSCLPEDKLRIITGWEAREEHTCMVGDGINDAPALKRAHVGIAMGGIGSDIAIEAADIVLTGDDIREIPHLIRLARKTMKTIRFNLAASMMLNFVAIIFAMTGILTPILGALVHNAGSVAVIINSSLLLKWRK